MNGSGMGDAFKLAHMVRWYPGGTMAVTLPANINRHGNKIIGQDQVGFSLSIKYLGRPWE